MSCAREEPRDSLNINGMQYPVMYVVPLFISWDSLVSGLTWGEQYFMEIGSHGQTTSTHATWILTSQAYSETTSTLIVSGKKKKKKKKKLDRFVFLNSLHTSFYNLVMQHFFSFQNDVYAATL